MMEKSRQRRGRLTRLGWSLAIVLLITPAHALAGSEWTLNGPEPVRFVGLRPIGSDGVLRVQSVEDSDSVRDAKDGDSTGDRDQLLELRGSEWT